MQQERKAGMWAGRLQEVTVSGTLPCLLEGKAFSSITYFPPLIGHISLMTDIEADQVWLNVH